MINAIPAEKCISEKFAPREIVTGKLLNINHFKAPFGEYLEVSTDTYVTNYMKGRTHPFISLGPSGNWKVLQICIDPETSKVVLIWTIARFPIPERVVKIISDWEK